MSFGFEWSSVLSKWRSKQSQPPKPLFSILNLQPKENAPSSPLHSTCTLPGPVPHGCHSSMSPTVEVHSWSCSAATFIEVSTDMEIQAVDSNCSSLNNISNVTSHLSFKYSPVLVVTHCILQNRKICLIYLNIIQKDPLLRAGKC